MYFVRKVLKGVETLYLKYEKLELTVVTASRKLRPNFQGHAILVKTNYLTRQVLKKPDLEGRMVSWSVELLEYDMQYVLRGNIKSQALAKFIVKLSSPIEEDPPFE